jgi:hypothetical protein
MDVLGTQWYAAGSLVIQAGFLLAAVWAVRSILKNMRASQEQMGVLLKLTLAGTHAELDSPSAARPTPYLLDGWPEAAQHPVSDAVPNARHEKSPRSIWSGVGAWLQTPMASSGISPWRRAVRWLQAPAGS